MNLPPANQMVQEGTPVRNKSNERLTLEDFISKVLKTSFYFGAFTYIFSLLGSLADLSFLEPKRQNLLKKRSTHAVTRARKTPDAVRTNGNHIAAALW